MPEYYRNYCVCPEEKVSVGMTNLNCEETTSYPVDVFNVNNELIGTATNQETYISIWNSDAANQIIGTLSAGLGSFSFILSLNDGQTFSECGVTGVPLPGRPFVFFGIYEAAYDEPEYE